MINFSNINAFNAGQRDSFEDLMCVLARREVPDNAAEFQPNEGSGGDGGVEAIWLLTDGSKIGYQAKFFLSLGDSQWQQMDESVRQALRVHPELKKYVIAIPRNLTPDRGGKSRGKSERQKWDERVDKWKGWASEQSIDIEFELWSETTLKEMLLREENVALIRYWFGGDVLNDAWFERQVSEANQTLGDRFNPDDHVKVSIESLFDTMVRGPHFLEKLEESCSELEGSVNKVIELITKGDVPDHAPFFEAVDAWRNTCDFNKNFSRDFPYKWDIKSALFSLDRLVDAAWTLEGQYDSVFTEQPTESDKQKHDWVSRDIRSVSSTCDSLREILRNQCLGAEHLQCAIIHGPAGAGKSHILGQVAEQRVCDGLPTILVLGQSLSRAVFWQQIGSVMGLDGRTADEVLGTLNAAGERKGERTLLLFDAINEGVGASYWMENLLGIVNAIKQYPYLAAIFSCRDEYLPYAIPATLSEKLPKFLINGFSTQEELELAAIRYLDAKGIARPNTPWLSPEYSNPLFLKSVSEALQAKGHTEFPRGLSGISQTMALYLDALSWRAGVDTTNPDRISVSIKKCIRLASGKMAAGGCDYVEVEQATRLAEESFEGRTPPEGKTWLQVLIEASLFRCDPPPYSEDIDPFNPPSDLVRFSFQRFQDHLMASSLVVTVTGASASEVFDRGGPLNFLFYDGEIENGFRYEYAGLVSALSTLYPEKLGVEFAKTLPNWEEQWENSHLLQEGFGESFKWRSTSAFLDDTRDLFKQLNDRYVDPLGLLLDVSMTSEHPFNALFLHSRLEQMRMSERDSQWTRWINWASREELSQVNRIVSWALSTRTRSADIKHLELASLILAWSLSSSHMTLRDRATKALITIFLAEPGIFDFVLEKMHSCDDPYVIERLYAATFGACCINQDPELLKFYSSKVYSQVFAGKEPPVALLTRDYALGVIELANRKAALCNGVCLENCYHPFNSVPPTFGLNADAVEKLAEERGGKEIFRSASSEWGDYGKYSIPGRVRGFSTTPLDQPTPVSKKEIKQSFVEEVIAPHPGRVAALEAYEEKSHCPSELILRNLYDELDQEEKDGETEKWERSKQATLRTLENLLSSTELERFSRDYLSAEHSYDDYDKVDVQQCRLWITQRAYQLGWNSQLFPHDGHGSSYSRHENDLERIGKKYQRIALDEIQARLADNFWALEDYPEKPYVYRYPHDQFRRNLEPTILPSDHGQKYSENWALEPEIKLPAVSEEKLKEWPFEEDPTESIAEKLPRVDENDRCWMVLYEFNCDKQKYPEPHVGEHGMRYEEFRFLYCVFVKQGKGGELAQHFETKRSLDVHSFQPRNFTDGPFLGEAHWRDTWLADKFSECSGSVPDGCEYAIPVAQYHWESHLDKSLPDGFACYLPEKWFAEELALSMSKENPNQWLDDVGKIVIQVHSGSEWKESVVIDEDVFLSYCKDQGLEPVWFMIAERNVWPNGSNKESCWRRSEAAVWQEDGISNQVGWNKDTKR